MPQMSIEIFKVTTGGPFSYIVSRNGVGVKAAIGQGNFATAFNNARDDAAALLDAGEVITRVTINIGTLA